MPEFESIGKYEVLDVIGEGGFGIVYKARAPLMERLVAIKVCSTEDTQVRKRFLREARIAGGLDHPNIVTAFDFGTEQDLPYLVQELLTGEDLRAKIDRQEPIEPAVKIDYLVQIAKGLEHAHSQGVLHRDIKPGNVRILHDNRVKLMDFGMAKIATDSGSRLTEAGSVMGTAGYFSPEQLMAVELDQRVDIFSFGVLAYELLTYRKAFPGDSFMVAFRQVLHDEPEPISSLWPECPSKLEDLVEKCLQKKREDRYDSFTDILPVLFSMLGSNSFDRRALRREADSTPEPAATLLKPIKEIGLPPAPESATEPPQTEPPQPAIEVSPESKPPKPLKPPEPVRPETRRAPKSSGSIAVPKSLHLGKKWLLGGVALVLVATLGIWWLSRSPDDIDSPTTVVESAPEDTSEPLAPAPSTPTFPVFVEANLWGEITQIVSETGEELALPDLPFTPMSLHLPAGSYTITVENPDSGELDACEVLVSEDAPQSCRISLPPLDAIEYFKESGWWE